MSHLYFVLGIIGWALTPIVILMYCLWPARRVMPRDSKTGGGA